MFNGVSTLPVSNHPDIAQNSSPPIRLATGVGPSGFVAGGENRLLVAVLQAWCSALSSPGALVNSDHWNRLASPLVLVGPTGSGKTHLAAGLANLAGNQQACITTANDLRREFADAIDSQDVTAWRERLAQVPVLVIDDLDHLPVRGNFQQELLHIAVARESLGHKLIVTSARPIAHLSGWLADLTNWFADGLTLEISPLGTAARRELLTQLVEANRWQLTDDALDVLVQHSSPEPRELFRMAADIERQFGRGARFEADTLTHFLNRRKASYSPELRDIIRVVARYYQIPLKTLTSASRQSAVVGARATAIYLARTLTSASYEQIGGQLGGRDHTTIMHSHRQVEKRLTHEAALRSAIDELTRLLRK